MIVSPEVKEPDSLHVPPRFNVATRGLHALTLSTTSALDWTGKRSVTATVTGSVE
jgi:hypothetical protein